MKIHLTYVCVCRTRGSFREVFSVVPVGKYLIVSLLVKKFPALWKQEVH